MNDVLFDAFERFRVQFRFAKNPIDFSFLIAQLHRAIAKSEKKTECESLQLPVHFYDIFNDKSKKLFKNSLGNFNGKRNKRRSKFGFGLVDTNA